MKRKLLLLLATALLVLGIGSASAEERILRFDRNGDTLFEGETLQTVLIREGIPAGADVIYTSANEKIAVVQTGGLVTGISRGQTTITATVSVEGRTCRAQMKVNVLRRVQALEIKTGKLPVYAADNPLVSDLIPAGEENLPVLLIPAQRALNLQVNVLPQDASNRKVELTSDNGAVLRIRGNELFGLTEGSAVLRIASQSNPEVFTRYRAFVVQPVKKLTVTASENSVAVGDVARLSFQAEPAGATILKVIWTSSDERIATVDQSGTVTGLKRGTVRLIATAADGSDAQASFSLKVTQNPERLILSQSELTVDTGRNAAVRASVEPKDADVKKVRWSSSDESIAKVATDGRITGIRPGTCTVYCVSEAAPSVSAVLTVHVQQPVRSLSFLQPSALVYTGESTRLYWKTEPADATNRAIAFSSSNEKVAIVDAQGLVTGISAGNATINAITLDGSRCRARIPVKVGQHVTGVEMVRKHAYIDLHETATAGAKIEPQDATNKNMTWVSSDESVVTATGKTNQKMRLKGVGYGEAVVTGTTEDGRFRTSLQVTVGNFDHSLSLREIGADSRDNLWLQVRNDSDFTITQITASVEMVDASDWSTKLAINKKDGSNKVDLVWNGTLLPGESTGKNHWKMSNYIAPEGGIGKTHGWVSVYGFQIDYDWIKTIREGNRKTMEY